LFAARGEADGHRNLDFLVVLHGIPKDLRRRHEVYAPIHGAVAMQTGRARDVRVIDLDEGFITNEDPEITSLMHNMASEANVLLDPERNLGALLQQVRSNDLKGCVQYSQLAAKNAGKAVAATRRTPSWGHDPPSDFSRSH